MSSSGNDPPPLQQNAQVADGNETTTHVASEAPPNPDQNQSTNQSTNPDSNQQQTQLLQAKAEGAVQWISHPSSGVELNPKDPIYISDSDSDTEDSDQAELTALMKRARAVAKRLREKAKKSQELKEINEDIKPQLKTVPEPLDNSSVPETSAPKKQRKMGNNRERSAGTVPPKIRFRSQRQPVRNEATEEEVSQARGSPREEITPEIRSSRIANRLFSDIGEQTLICTGNSTRDFNWWITQKTQFRIKKICLTYIGLQQHEPVKVFLKPAEDQEEISLAEFTPEHQDPWTCSIVVNRGDNPSLRTEGGDSISVIGEYVSDNTNNENDNNDGDDHNENDNNDGDNHDNETLIGNFENTEHPTENDTDLLNVEPMVAPENPITVPNDDEAPRHRVSRKRPQHRRQHENDDDLTPDEDEEIPTPRPPLRKHHGAKQTNTPRPPKNPHDSKYSLTEKDRCKMVKEEEAREEAKKEAMEEKEKRELEAYIEDMKKYCDETTTVDSLGEPHFHDRYNNNPEMSRRAALIMDWINWQKDHNPNLSNQSVNLMRSFQQFCSQMHTDFTSNLSLEEWNAASETIPNAIRNFGAHFEDLRPLTDWLYNMLPPVARDPPTIHKDLRFKATLEGVLRMKEHLQPEFTRKMWEGAECCTPTYQEPIKPDVKELIQKVSEVDKSIEEAHIHRFGDDYKKVDWSQEHWATNLPDLNDDGWDDASFEKDEAHKEEEDQN